MTEAEYIDLVDFTGRELRPGKRGVIKGDEPPALRKLGFDKNHWDVPCVNAHTVVPPSRGQSRSCGFVPLGVVAHRKDGSPEASWATGITELVGADQRASS